VVPPLEPVSCALFLGFLGPRPFPRLVGNMAPPYWRPPLLAFIPRRFFRLIEVPAIFAFRYRFSFLPNPLVLERGIVLFRFFFFLFPLIAQRMKKSKNPQPVYFSGDSFISKSSFISLSKSSPKGIKYPYHLYSHLESIICSLNF